MAQRDAQLLGFAGDLCLDTSDLPSDQLAGALARELDGRAQSFLWIVDDLPAKLTRAELDGWLAPGRHGKTLATTRSRDYGAVGSQIDLGVLTVVEGVELPTHHRQPNGATELDAARGLVHDLGRHALALDVTGAALRADQGVRSYAQYRAALADPSEDELELATRYIGELPNGHEPSIASTLARSIACLDDAGRDFLRFAAVPAVQPIETSVSSSQIVRDTSVWTCRGPFSSWTVSASDNASASCIAPTARLRAALVSSQSAAAKTSTTRRDRALGATAGAAITTLTRGVVPRV